MAKQEKKQNGERFDSLTAPGYVLPADRKDDFEGGAGTEGDPPDDPTPSIGLARNVRIKGATIVKETFLRGAFHEAIQDGGMDIKFDHSIYIHPDLKKAFDALRPDFIALCELYDSEGNRPDIKRVIVKSFKLDGADDTEEFTLAGIYELSTGKIMDLETPAQRWNDPGNPYANADKLSMLIETLKAEVYQYLFEKKHRPDPQLDIFAGAPSGRGDSQDAFKDVNHI